MATAHKITAEDFNVELILSRDEAAMLHHLLYRGVECDGLPRRRVFREIRKALETHVFDDSQVCANSYRWREYAVLERRKT